MVLKAGSANWQVATGTVLSPTIAATRNEADFAAHIAGTIETDAQAGWIFIVDAPQHAPIRNPSALGGSLLQPESRFGRKRQVWHPRFRCPPALLF